MSIPPVQPVASYTGSLQYEDSISCTLYRFLLPLRRQFDFAPFFVVERKIVVLSKKSSSAFFLVDFPSIHPSILSTAFSSSSKRCFTRILLLCQVFGLVLVVSSDSRSPINPFSSYQSASFCSLGEYVSRPLLRENFYLPSSISSTPCQSFRTSLVFLEFANQLFPQSYDSCLHSRSAPSPSPRLLSRLHFVFVSIYSMSSLQYRRYTLIRPLHVSQPSPPSYSSRYPRQCLLTISTIRPSIPLLSLILTSVSPTFPSAISTFYLVAFVNVPSYSASIYF